MMRGLLVILGAMAILNGGRSGGAEPRADDGHWAWQPAKRPALPGAGGSTWVRNPIDWFVLAGQKERGLRPSPDADRRTLIRRLSFDLTGLPPSPDEVRAFLTDPAPDAYERLVERLLASPCYGERWARHWFDLVHFGESHGYDKDKPRPNAWPYRDYVIRSFNQDKPYGRFVQEQIAGDVLFPGDRDGVIATGFIAAGPWDFVGHVELREGTIDKELTRSNDRDDMVMTTMSTFQSLTAHCARCHNHKFDPIRQEDYYRLQADFAGIDRGDRPIPVATGPATEGRGSEKRMVFAAVPLARPRPIHLLIRGDVKQPRELVSPGAIAFLTHGSAAFELANPDDEGARRAALARWITDPSNPLTNRSIVNRIWQYHFGKGIVETPSDFGHMGAAPSDPELLDWLATWFAGNGQSIKALTRLIVTSATYRQISAPNPMFAMIDAENRYLWRMNRTRLDAECVHDAILACGGRLDTTMGGPSVQQFFFKDDHSPVYDYGRFDVNSPGALRRSIYRFIVRSVPDPFMETMDCPDASLLTPKRSTTVTALQALSLLNNPFVTRQAEHMAQRIAGMAGDGEGQVSAMFEIALGRRPDERELKLVTDYAARHGLANACRIVLNSNEFVFVD